MQPLIEGRAKGDLGREEKLIDSLANQMGMPITYATEKQLLRNKVETTREMVPIGSVGFVRAALQRWGKTLPDHTPYPFVLYASLHRQVKEFRSLRDAKALLDDGQRWFIKPAKGWKRFTGFVAEFSDDHRFNGASNSMPVWISTPVTFLSEWRVYVADGQVREVCFADHGGDRTIRPDMTTITCAIGVLRDTGVLPAGFVIDFGVLDTGKTALIEMNDGFSFGAYDDVSAETYWQVASKRWQQLMET